MSAWPTLDLAPRLSQADELASLARAAVVEEAHVLALREACVAARVRVLRRTLKVGERRHRAMLVPVIEGFHAIVDSLLWTRAASGDRGRRRLRFVLAHELAHTFFYRPGRPPSRTSSPDRFEEEFCHRFATLLLVPQNAARAAHVDPRGLHALAGHYDVSVRVAAWAIARTRPALSLLWLRRAPHPLRGDSEAMRVAWSASQRFIPPGESLKSDLADLAPGETGPALNAYALGVARTR
jgi:IrrE N-terminal-like domain